MDLTLSGVGIDTDDLATAQVFWAGVTGYAVAHADDAGAFLADPAGSAAGLYLQLVPESRAGKNRLHLDFTTADVDAEVDRVLGLGASEVARHDKGEGNRWVVLADPDGNQFCICAG